LLTGADHGFALAEVGEVYPVIGGTSLGGEVCRASVATGGAREPSAGGNGE